MMDDGDVGQVSVILLDVVENYETGADIKDTTLGFPNRMASPQSLGVLEI